MRVLGIDAGGSKTVALLAGLDGQVVAEGRAGGANLRTHGELVVEKTLHEVIDQVLDRHTDRPVAVCLGIAGVDRDDDAATIRGVMRRLGFREHTLIVNDALIALVAGALEPVGLVVVAGTGSIAYGVNAAGQAARSGGWGPVLADEGSGYWIGRRALVAVMRHADGRGPRTALTPMVFDRLHVTRADEIVSEVYEGAERRQLVATLGPLVAQAQAAGDAVAGEILTEAATELAMAAASVIGRLEMRGHVFPTFLSGGVFRSLPWLAAEVTSRLGEVAPRSTVSLLTAEPAAGAVALARAEAAGRARVPVYLDAAIAQPVIVESCGDPIALARALASRVCSAIEARPDLVLGLPTGRTPLPFYEQLRLRSGGQGADWSRVRTFNLDEFVAPGAGLYREYMARELFDHVNLSPANIEFLRGDAPDLEGECERYERALAAVGGLDLIILGIGANGHIGFNEPGAALEARTHRTRLLPATRQSNRALFDDRLDAVPAEALSMGMATILQARQVVLIATGAAKASAVTRMLQGPITTELPASFLQLHPDATVMADLAASPR